MGTVTSTILVNNSAYGSTYNGTLSGGASGTVVTQNNIKLTTFAYQKDTYTKAEKNPTPIVLGDSGGVFSSSAGLILNAGTGQINTSTSTPGTYTVNYTIPASCSTASTKLITIVASNTIDFSYPKNTYCITDGIITPTLTGPAGGVYYSDPLGLYMDKDSGDIITASSTIGDYDVYYSRNASFGTWSQIGSDIDAEEGSSGSIQAENRNGISLRLNAAGNVLLTLSSNNNNNATRAGQMRAFYNNNGTWERIGHNIGGETAQSTWHQSSSSHIAVNDSGDIIAMANPKNDGACNDCGRVIVLKRKNGIWSQLGSEIEGDSATAGKTFFGLSIALNSAGNVLAIGDHRDSAAGAEKGVVHIYEFNGTDWIRKGATGKINPPDDGDTTPRWGLSVDLDSSGNTVVIGSNTHDSKGRFAVYEYDAPNWNKKGDSKSGGSNNDFYGHDVSINADGNMILIGQPRYDTDQGRTYAYKYNEGDNEWKYWAYDCVLCETTNNRRSGWSVALNTSGNTAAIGAPHEYTGGQKGRVTVWKQIQKYVSGDLLPTWTKIGNDIVGELNNGRFGWSVDLNAKGNIVAIGAPNNDQIGGNDPGMVRVYELISDNSRDPFKVSIVDSGTYDTTISYPGSSTLNQGDIPITPTITESGGTFTVTPTYRSIQYPGQWGPSGDYYLSIDPTTGVVSPSVSLAGTYSITYTIGCDSTTISMTIRSVNDIDHTLTYSPTTICISDGGNLRPTIIPITTHYVVPRVYLDPGNINSYADEGNALNNTPITNITTNSAYNHWSGNWSNNANHHPDFRLKANPGDVEHIPGYSWKINTNHRGNSINNSGSGFYRKFFPRWNFSVSVWVNETDWTNDAQIFDWANGDMNSGQVEFYYESSVPRIRIHNNFYQMGDFLPNNNQWYNFVITRQKDGPDGLAILKFYVNGELKHTENGTDNRTLDDRGDIHFGRNQGGVNNTNTSRAFIGQFGPIKIFNDPISPSQVEYEFDSFAPRYLTDSFTSTPAGLSLDSTTGIIDVAASVTGTYSITLSWTEPVASTLQSAQTSITIESSDASFTYPGSPTLNQGDSPITPTIIEPGGTFTVTPTHGGIYYANQWGPSGAYYLSIDPLTGVVSPSASLAGTYSITYITSCGSSTMSMKIRSVNDIDHTLTYSPTTVCITDGEDLRPIIIPTTAHSLVPRIYLDPGNINSYSDQGSATNLNTIKNLTTNNAYSHWNGNVVNTPSLHPDFQLRVNGTDIEHIPGYSWKIKTNNKDNTIINDDSINSSFFPVDDFSLSIWVKEENWNDGSKTYIFDWASAALTTGQIEFLYGNKGNLNCPDPNKACPWFRINSRIWVLGDFLPNNNQWYNFVITRSQKGPESTIGGIPFSAATDFGVLKFYVDGVLMHTEYGVDDNQLSNQGTISFGRNQSNRDIRKSTDFFIGEIGPIKIFDQVLSPSQVEYEFDSFAPRYLPDSFSSSPAGLSLDNTTGIIDVAASVTGTYSVTLSWEEAIAATPHSGQTSITIESNIVSITYPEIAYCIATIGTVTPSIIGVTSGTFTSSPTGLSIVSSTGIITPELSSVATYTILFTSDGECPGTSSFTLAITDTESTSISYPEISYCQGTIGTVTPTIVGVTSGTFTVSPTGLIIDPITGIITPELSSIATYTILFTGDEECTGTSSFTLSITDEEEDASFNYPEISYCQGTIGTVTPTIIGVVSGTFTASPTGLIIDPITGIISPELSSIATYTIEYTTSGDCPGTSSFTLSITDFEEDATFKYAASSYCINDMSIITPIISNPGGTISSSPPGLSIDLTNGEITPNLSLTGTYTIEYTTSGDCPSTSSTTVIINDLDDSTFIYSSNVFCTSETNVATPTITTPGGTFTFSPAGLSIDLLTGVVSPGSSLAGTYSITYTTPITKNLSYSIPQQANLIGHYPLDNNKEDASGKGYHGTNVTETSNPISASNRFGTPSSALEFDGDDSIYFGDEMVNEFNATGKDSFTISIWIKHNTSTQKAFMSLGLGTGCNNNNRGVVFRTGSVGGQSAEFSGCNRRGRITGNFADNNWHHYVFRYDKNVGRTVFIDGISRTVERSTDTNLHTILTNGLSIGGGYHPNPGQFIGFLDDLKIWNTPLTDDEITNLYSDEDIPPATPALGPISVGCVNTSTISITIAEKASGTLTYPHENIILDATFCALDANIIPDVSSTVSGTFSSSPSGLDIDPISGKIKFGSSTAGSYTVLYEMPSLYCGTTTLSKTIVIKGSCDGSDSDGDGVPDVTEILPPETDPFDGCDYYFLHQHQDFVSPAWAASDCDGDGVANGDELGDNTDPNNACSFKRQSITLPITAIGLDCDGDGVPGYKEEAEDNTDSINSCSLIIGNISLIVTSLEDCDGDGVSNADEASDKTNPLDGCSFALSRSGKGKTKGWEALDCDGDGVLNGNEETDGTDVFNNCSYYLSSMTINPTKGFDCDGDGVTNWQEVKSFTDPTDECDLDPSTIDFEISNEWYETDCDGDTFKNSVDVFPFYKLEWFDTDNDLVGNNQDLDDDNDGIIDSEEGDNDLDNDGISNAMDTDSDGDGCPDAIEAGYTDPDNNGILGSGDVQVNLDGKVLSNGGYSQIADNDSNNIYDYLEFGSKVDIITNPNKTYEIYRQSSIEISVTAEAKSTISYKWQLNKNGASISSKSNGWEDINDSQDYTGTKTNKLSILDPQFSMEGWNYRLVTSSPCYVCGGETISDPAELIISELFIPNAFSPDGDGINDTWTIRGGLYNYPNNNLVIFNRWGLKVYEADGYNNNWDGNNKSNSSSGNDSKLPSGTYFYVLDLNGNGKNVKKGFIYLTRLNE